MSGHDSLVKMANQIAQYFASEPDRALAVQGVRQHLQSFWTPAMRRQLGSGCRLMAGRGWIHW